MAERINFKKMLIQTYLDTRKQGTLKLESWKFELGSWKSLTRHQGSPPQLKQLLQACGTYLEFELQFSKKAPSSSLFSFK